jgi:uncharacterized protein (DUF362 family)
MAKKAKPVQHPDYVKAPMDRRTFFRRIATAGGIGGAVGYAALAPEEWPLSRKDSSGLLSVPRHSPFQLPDYNAIQKPMGAFDLGIGHGSRPGGDEGDIPVAELNRMLDAALDAVGGLRHYIRPGDIVLVKPNVAFDRAPNLGATSNPALVELLVRKLYDDCNVQEVRVADNPIESPADCFAKSGVRRAAEQGGGRVYLPDSNAFKMLHTPGAKLIENWWFFHRPFTNVDKVIGLSPVKDHNLCNASMGIKNWYGLLGGTRNQFHQDINGIVSDLTVMMRPTLTILDGTHVLMQNGPTGGDPSNVKKKATVVASLDPVACDAWAFEHLLERGRDYPAYLWMAEEKHQGRFKMDYEGRVKEIHT